MTPHRRPGSRLALALAAGLVLCLGAAACSAGAAAKQRPASHHRTPARSSSPAQPASGPPAQAAVKAMWQEFFNGAVPIPRRLTLLQNGQRFASFVRSQAKTSLGSLVLAATGKVRAVALGPSGQATVTYAILLAGKPVAKNLSGTAVYVAGRWLVAQSTFCSLLHVAYGKQPKLIPAVCGT